MFDRVLKSYSNFTRQINDIFTAFLMKVIIVKTKKSRDRTVLKH